MTRIYKRRREDALPTPRTALRSRYVRVLVFCNSAAIRRTPTCVRSCCAARVMCR